MKFKSKETKYLQFGRYTVKLEKGKVYDTEKDFDDKFVQPIKYIVKMNAKLFNVIDTYKKTQNVVKKETVNKPKPVQEPVEEIESDIVEEPVEESTTEEPETTTITKSELDGMTKSDLLVVQERFNLDVTSSNLKQEIYEQVEAYLMENDLLVD